MRGGGGGGSLKEKEDVEWDLQGKGMGVMLAGKWWRGDVGWEAVLEEGKEAPLFEWMELQCELLESWARTCGK